MLLLAVSDLVWQALIAGVVTIVITWMQYKTKESIEKNTTTVKKNANIASERADVAASKAEEVKSSLVIATEESQAASKKISDKLDENIEITKIVHTLVNNDMHKALKAIYNLAKWKADMTKLPADIDAAQDAFDALANHDAKQVEVDKRTNTD